MVTTEHPLDILPSMLNFSMNNDHVMYCVVCKNTYFLDIKQV